jgi:hypothetical protein
LLVTRVEQHYIKRMHPLWQMCDELCLNKLNIIHSLMKLGDTYDLYRINRLGRS